VRISRPVAALAAALLVGCGADARPTHDPLEAATTLTTLPQIDSAVLETLKELHPRLTAEPLPEPRPSPDANPAAPPPGMSRLVLETIHGDATFYARIFEGRRTASGIPFRQNQMVAAHRAYPFGTLLRVTNLRNERSVTVRVVDRGPFGSSAHARRTVIDLSLRAAERLGFVQAGRTAVKVEVLEWGEGVVS